MTGAGRVTVVGSFMMDLVVEAPRRPDRGETVFGSGFEIFLGGKGCNQALAAARCGARTAMVGRLGADDFGRQFLARLERDGIDATHVVVDEVEGTGVGAPVVEPNGDNSIVVVPRANHRLTPDDIRSAADVLRSADVVLLQLELPMASVRTAAQLAREAGALVVLNPAPAAGPLEGFDGLVDVLVPNEGEAVRLAGVAGSPAELASQLHRSTGAAVVVTAGDQGAWLADGAEVQHVAAHSVSCIDSVGAGDAFCGALAARLATGVPLDEAVRYGSAAAAVSVTRRGAEPSMPTAAEVAAFLATVAPATGTLRPREPVGETRRS